MNNDYFYPATSWASVALGAWVVAANDYLQFVAFIVSITTGLLYLATKLYDLKKKDKKDNDGEEPPDVG